MISRVRLEDLEECNMLVVVTDEAEDTAVEVLEFEHSVAVLIDVLALEIASSVVAGSETVSMAVLLAAVCVRRATSVGWS